MKEPNIVLIEAGSLSPPSELLRDLLRFHAKEATKNTHFYLSLARSTFYFCWQSEHKDDDLFPLPKEKLIWNDLPLEEGDQPLRLYMGLPKELVARFRTAFDASGLPLDGITVPFLTHTEWVYRRTSPAENWVLIYEHDGAIDITLAHRNVPLFSRSIAGVSAHEVNDEIASLVSYVQQSRPTYKPEQIIEVAGPDLLGHEKILLEKKLYIQLPRRRTKLQLYWDNNRKNIAAGGSAALVLLSVLLNAGIQNTQADLSKLSGEERQIRIASHAPRARVRGQDSALESLTVLLNQIPPSTYLIDVRYDGSQRLFSLQGRSSDYGRVSKVAAALAQQKYFSHVHVDKSSLIQSPGRPIVEFSLEAKLR